MKNKFLILLIILCLFINIGCTNKKVEENIETEKSVYLKYVKEIKKIKESSKDLPFNVDIKYEKMKDEVRYQVIIDNPTTDIINIRALAFHNKQTDDIFPSIGIFDKKVNLIPNKKPSGVILVGYFPYEGDIDKLNLKMKVLIEYKMNNEKHKSYYVTKK